MNVWVSTTNKNKLNEFKAIIGPLATIRSVAELSYYSAPAETGATFVDNARIKAKALKALKPEEWVVADDSGLEVDGLGGLPGVHSARYAGDRASDAENVAKLLKMVQIRSANNRRAQMICVLVAYDPAGVEHVIRGVVTGNISMAAKGNTGFGYDPIFIPEEHDKTFSELGAAVKNQISHRSRALRIFAQKLSPV